MFKQTITTPLTLAGLVCLTVGVARAQPANDAPPPPPDAQQQPPQGDGANRPDRAGPHQDGDRPNRQRMQQRGDFGGDQGGRRGMMPDGMPGAEAIQMQDATYLGVEVSPIDPAMKSQLKLTKTDSGLMVNFVAADSPAKAAGLQQYDVLTKVDDQILFNPPQLQSLVRIHKSADEIKITYIREGTTNTASAKLITKQQMVEPMFGGGWGGGAGMMGAGPGPEMQDRMRQMMGESGTTNRTVTYASDDMSLTVQVENGKPVLVAKDKAGKELFNGAIETPEQREAIPAEVRKGLDKVAVNYLITSLNRPARPMGLGGGFGPGRGMGGGGMGGRGPGGGAGPGPNRGPGPDRPGGGPDR